MASPTPPNGPPAADVALVKRIRPQVWIAGGAAVLLVGIALTCAFSGGSKSASNAAGFDAELMKTNPGAVLTRMAAILHPYWQVVSTNDHNGTITLIDKSTGKPVTYKLDPAQNILVVTATETPAASAEKPPDTPAVSPPGSGGVPAWVPIYPASTLELKSFAQTPLDGDQSIFTFTTTDAPTKVAQYYQDQLKSAGFKLNVASSGEQGGMVQAEDPQQKRSIIVQVEDSGEGTKARVVVVEKK